MNSKVIQQGAEAKIILNGKENFITKDRIPKSYRIKELDDKIRKLRTRSEIKLLQKASKIINVPLPLINSGSVEVEGRKGDFTIILPYLNGKKLSDNLNKFPLTKQKQICKKIGEEIAKLHDADIIHGDLTTSNIILVHCENDRADKIDCIYFIDFGLGYISRKFEDKAVDIHLFKEALEAKHFQNWEILFKEFGKGYKKSKEAKVVFERLKIVEKRGRYRH